MAGLTAVPGAHGHAGRPSPGSRPEGRGAWLEGKPAPLLSGGGQLSCVGRGLETAPSGHSGGTGAPGAGSHPRGPAAGGQQRRQEATCHQAVRRGCSLQHSEHKTRPVWRKLETFFTSKDLPNSGAVCCGNLRPRGGSRPASPGFWEVWRVSGQTQAEGEAEGRSEVWRLATDSQGRSADSVPRCGQDVWRPPFFAWGTLRRTLECHHPTYS